MTLPAAETIGPYRIIEQIGTGGMATVYRANHERLDREVAIKVMHQSFLQDQTFLARFEREARIVGSLEHPNIVPVYDYDEYKGQPYLVLKYIEGQTLKQRFIKQPLNLDEILTMMGQIAGALTYAHERGVLHRDIKPSNIIIDQNDVPHLTDFGLARIAQSGESTMSADMMLGTPQYISPEQARGDSDLDARTDVYSFGIILYELVTGAVPFSGETTYAIVHKQIYAAPPRPTQLNPDVPVAVERVLLRALDKDRTRRHDSPNALMGAFADAVKSSGLDALDEDRASLARAAADEISAHTPRGGRYVSIPAPGPAPQVPLSDSRAERINATVQDVGDRIKQAVQDVGQDVQKKETFRRIFDNLKTSISFGPTDDSSSVAATGDAVRSGSASVHVVRAGKSHPVRNHSKQPKGSRRIVAVPNDITRDWSLDEDMVRSRITQRRERRNGFLLHVVFYLLAVGGMAASYNAVHPGLAEYLVSPEVVNEVGGDFLAPLANLRYPLIFALFWGGFIISHGLNTFYNTGGRLIRRRQSLLSALDAQHGPDWQNTISQREYRRVRRRVNNRYNRRLRFMMHAFTGFMITAAVFTAWPPLRDTLIGYAPGDEVVQFMIDQPIPQIVALFMSLTVVLHGIFSFLGSIIDNGGRERSYRRELDRERELASLAQPVPDKRKLDELLDEEKPKHGLRLNEEGEFTDSLAAELNDEGWQRDATRRD